MLPLCGQELLAQIGQRTNRTRYNVRWRSEFAVVIKSFQLRLHSLLQGYNQWTSLGEIMLDNLFEEMMENIDNWDMVKKLVREICYKKRLKAGLELELQWI